MVTLGHKHALRVLHSIQPGLFLDGLQLRNHNKIDNNETLQCESSDGGRTYERMADSPLAVLRQVRWRFA